MFLAIATVALLTVSVGSVSSTHRIDFSSYHHHVDLSEILHDIENRTRPDGLCTRFSIGRSVEGRELYGIRVSPADARRARPSVAYVAQIHGNEPVGREMTLRFAALLCTT